MHFSEERIAPQSVFTWFSVGDNTGLCLYYRSFFSSPTTCQLCIIPPLWWCLSHHSCSLWNFSEGLSALVPFPPVPGNIRFDEGFTISHASWKLDSPLIENPFTDWKLGQSSPSWHLIGWRAAWRAEVKQIQPRVILEVVGWQQGGTFYK